MDNIFLRKAVTESCREKAFRLRYQVFIKDTDDTVIRHSEDNLMIADIVDKEATLLVAETTSGEAVGTVGVACGKAARGLLESRYSLSAKPLEQFGKRLACGFWLAVKNGYANRKFNFPDMENSSSTVGIALVAKAVDIAIQQDAAIAFITTKPALKAYFERLGFFCLRENHFHDYWQEPRTLMAVLMNGVNKDEIRGLSIPDFTAPVTNATELMKALVAKGNK